MNLEAVRAARESRSDLSDADFIAFANQTVTEWATCYVSYRLIRATLMQVSPDAAKSKTEAIAAFIKVADPLADQMLAIPGDTDGTAGGVDISLAPAQMMIDAVQGQNILTQPEADAIRSLSRSTHTRYTEWGCVQFGTTEMATLNGTPAPVDPTVLLSVHSTPDTTLLSYRSQSATFAIHTGVEQTLTAAQQALLTTVLAAIAAFVEAE